MDREHDLQFLGFGFCGIIKESFRVCFQCRKILCKIAMVLIFPPSAIFLVHFLFSDLILAKMLDNSSSYHDSTNARIGSQVLVITYSELAGFLIFKLAYFLITIVFSLLSTSAVIFTIACFYSKKEISFRKVLKAVPKAWLRLIVTFLWYVLFFFALSVVFGLFTSLFGWISGASFGIGITALVIVLLLQLIASVYLTIVWELASVVSILETVYGIKSMVKSRNLIKGKIIVSAAIFIVVGVFFVGIEIPFEILIGLSMNLGVKILLGIVFCSLLVIIFIFGLVSQAVLYFVCKSHHHEAIDRASLSAHLDQYLGYHVPQLNPHAVQLEQINVEQKV